MANYAFSKTIDVSYEAAIEKVTAALRVTSENMRKGVKRVAIKKVTIDKDACAAAAVCEAICPEVFEVDEYSKVKKGVDLNKYGAEIKEAAESCPTQAILVEEE